MSSNYPPGVTGSESQIVGFVAWEGWAESVKPGDRCLVAGVEATVTAVTEDFLWARLDGRADAEPWDWEQTGPLIALEGPAIYAASRASVPERPAMWLRLRDGDGYRIISSWLDESGPGATLDWAALWSRCIEEVASADRLVLYAEASDLPLRGALVEVGAALAAGVPVVVVSPDAWELVGSWTAHPLVRRARTVQEAME